MNKQEMTKQRDSDTVYIDKLCELYSELTLYLEIVTYDEDAMKELENKNFNNRPDDLEKIQYVGDTLQSIKKSLLESKKLTKPQVDLFHDIHWKVNCVKDAEWKKTPKGIKDMKISVCKFTLLLNDLHNSIFNNRNLCTVYPELRENVREELQTILSRTSDITTRDKIEGTLTKNTDIKVPKSLRLS